MKQFEIVLPRKPSALAGITEVLAQNGVNIRGISSYPSTRDMVVSVVTDDEATTRTTLAAKKVDFSEREALSMVIPDRPGEIAKLARRLARRMIFIESIYMLSRKGGKTEVAFTADNMKKAVEALRSWKG
jgi:hypothetical protein